MPFWKSGSITSAAVVTLATYIKCFGSSGVFAPISFIYPIDGRMNENRPLLYHFMQANGSSLVSEPQETKTEKGVRWIVDWKITSMTQRERHLPDDCTSTTVGLNSRRWPRTMAPRSVCRKNATQGSSPLESAPDVIIVPPKTSEHGP